MVKNPISTKNPYKDMFKGSRAKILKGMHRPEGAGNFDGADDTGLFKDIKIKGTKGSVLFHDGDLIQENNPKFFWDNANGRMGIGTATPGVELEVAGDIKLNQTNGSVIFIADEGVLTQDNAKFFWDDTSKRLGIGTNTPQGKLEVVDTTTPFFLTHQRAADSAGDLINLIIERSGAVGGDGLGASISFKGETSTTLKRDMGRITASWEDATDASRNSNLIFKTIKAGVEGEGFRITSAGNLGLGTTTPGDQLTLAGGALVVRETDDGNNAVKLFSGASNGLVDVSASGVVVIRLGGASTSFFNTGQKVGIQTTAPVCDLDINGGLALNLVSKTTTYIATSSDHTILCDASSAAFTVTLPSASGVSGIIYNIKKTDSSANAVTVDGADAETIDGGTTAVINTQYESISIQCDGSNWHII